MLPSSLSQEWLVTNGLGSWASGTVLGANTRRYHGWFVPALRPPLGRTVLVSKLEETVQINGQTFALWANEFLGGKLMASPAARAVTFRLEGLIPTWTYTLGTQRLIKRVWMPAGTQTAFATYTLEGAGSEVIIEVQLAVTERDAHQETRGASWAPQVLRLADGVRVQVLETPFWVRTNCGVFAFRGEWRRDIQHRIETERGLPNAEDHYLLGNFAAALAPGATLVLTAALTPDTSLDWAAALQAEPARTQALLAQAQAQAEPAWVQQLVLAADQFIVQRELGQTVLAGYHWFSDWGRDTMIALPGLMLTTRRFDVAAETLRTFARYVSQGMLPNRFPDEGEQPEYNTVDATLWYFHALERYEVAAGDQHLARELWPILEDIIAWHLHGTRYGIHVDPADGLLQAGVPGAQLTWMDVKIKDWVVTPRHGKPVEINALWINALRVMAAWAREFPAQRDYAVLADQAEASFTKFWYGAGGYLSDVLDTPPHHAPDPTLRPNQLIALSLPHGPRLRPEQARAVVEKCQAALLTPRGLRSLAPTDPAYMGIFAGDMPTRDAAYHQGTVWGWLIGPFVEAHLKVFGDRAAARAFLEPFAAHLQEAGMGTISEVFDGNAPHAPRGCMAQAWSVSEVLRLWMMLREK